MKYNYIFNNLAAYTAACGSGGVVLTALNEIGAGKVSRTVVSYIEDIGKVMIDCVNCIISQNDGAVGDMLVYHPTHGYKYVKGGTWSTTNGGCTINQTVLVNNNYTPIGWLGYRAGKDCLIIDLSDTSSGIAWGDTSTLVPSPIFTASVVQAGNGVFSWIASASMYLAEYRYANSGYIYTYPLRRSLFDACCDAAKNMTAYSNSHNVNNENASYTATTSGTASMTYTDGNGTHTINPKDYDWSFDKWYNSNILCRYPSFAGAGSDMNGKLNTKAIVTTFNSTYAAHICNNKSVAGVGDFGAGKWWLPSAGEFLKILRGIKKLIENGSGLSISGVYWTSTQCSALYAWYVNVYHGYVRSGARSSACAVRAVSAFQIK